MKIPDYVHPIKCPISGYDLYVYVLTGRKTTLVDSGIASTPSAHIFPSMTKKNLPPSSISTLINTHGHCDHAGGNSAVKEKSLANIAAHQLDVPWIEDHGLHFGQIFARYPEFYLPTREAKLGFCEDMGVQCKVDNPLRDGDMLSVGDVELQVVHTPGHTPGSICLYDKSNRMLFSGDSIQGRGTNIPAFSTPIYTDLDSYVKSLQRIDQMTIDLLLAAHPYKPFKDSIIHSEEIKGFISESLRFTEEVQARILEFLGRSSRPLSLGEITKAICVEFGAHWSEPIGIFPLHLVDTHLHALLLNSEVDYIEKEKTWKAKR